MAKKPCSKQPCPVIHVQCTAAQQENDRCFVKVGSLRINTRTPERSAARAAALAVAQRKRRCEPEVRTHTEKAVRKSADAALEKKLLAALKAAKPADVKVDSEKDGRTMRYFYVGKTAPPEVKGPPGPNASQKERSDWEKFVEFHAGYSGYKKRRKKRKNRR